MLLKSCRCGKLIPQSMKMCEECERQQQSRHMIYNNTRRDERAAEFYISKEWRAMRERIIEVYDNVDIYALYVEHELLTCNPVHHIVELEDDWEQRLNPFNLIPLNHKTHNTTPLMEDVPVYETKTNPDTGEKERVQVGTRQVVNGERERLMVIQDRCMKQCRQGASDFGLTVSSRCRLVVPKPQQQKPENKFAKYAN